MHLQTMLHAVFPPECLTCGNRVESDFSICGSCWAETPFIFGAACDLCGAGLPGQSAAAGEVLICDECHRVPRPWCAGRAVMGYAGLARRLVLGLKHGDRADIARAAAPWLKRAGRDFWPLGPVLVPIPLYWGRLAKRRYNQAALLAQWLAREADLEVAPQALVRRRNTGTQDGKDRDGRYANVADALVPHAKHGSALKGRAVVLIDDVMTSGATFSSATAACAAAGADTIRVLALARVTKDT